MRLHQTLAAASVLLLAHLAAGCDGGLAAPSAPAGSEIVNAEATQALTPRPLTGRCETTFRLHPVQPPPPVVRQIDEGTCRLAHLGRSAFYSVKEINFATGTQITTEASFTAANGDSLRAVGEGTSAVIGPGIVGFSATLTFIGGTGRFSDASGEAHVEGEADVAASTASFAIVEGWIAYTPPN